MRPDLPVHGLSMAGIAGLPFARSPESREIAKRLRIPGCALRPRNYVPDVVLNRHSARAFRPHYFPTTLFISRRAR